MPKLLFAPAWSIEPAYGTKDTREELEKAPRLIPTDSGKFWIALVITVHAAPWLMEVLWHAKLDAGRPAAEYLVWLLGIGFGVAGLSAGLIATARLWAWGAAMFRDFLPAVFSALVLWAGCYTVRSNVDGVLAPVLVGGAGIVAVFGVMALQKLHAVSVLGYRATWLVPYDDSRTKTRNPHPLHNQDRYEYGVWVVTAIAALMYGMYTFAKELPAAVPPAAGSTQVADISHGPARTGSAESAAPPVSDNAAGKGVSEIKQAGDSQKVKSKSSMDVLATKLYEKSAYKLAEAAVISCISIFFVAFVARISKAEATIDETAKNAKLAIDGSSRSFREFVDQANNALPALNKVSDKLKMAEAAAKLDTIAYVLANAGATGSRLTRMADSVTGNLKSIFEKMLTETRAPLESVQSSGSQRNSLAVALSSASLYATYFRALHERLHQRQIVCNLGGRHWVRMETSFDHYATVVRQVVRELIALQRDKDHPYTYQFYTTFEGDPLLWLYPWAWMEHARPEVRMDPYRLTFTELFSRWLQTAALDAQGNAGPVEFYRWCVVEKDTAAEPLYSAKCPIGGWKSRAGTMLLCHSHGDVAGKPVVIWSPGKAINFAGGLTELENRDSQKHYRRLYEIQPDGGKGKADVGGYGSLTRSFHTQRVSIEEVRGVLEAVQRAYTPTRHRYEHVNRWADPGYVYIHNLEKDQASTRYVALPPDLAKKYVWKSVSDVVAQYNFGNKCPHVLQTDELYSLDFRPFSPRWEAVKSRTVKPSMGERYSEKPVRDIFAVRRVPKNPPPNGKGDWIICIGAQPAGDYGQALLMTYAATSHADEGADNAAALCGQRKQMWKDVTEELDRWFLPRDYRKISDWRDDLRGPVLKGAQPLELDIRAKEPADLVAEGYQLVEKVDFEAPQDDAVVLQQLRAAAR